MRWTGAGAESSRTCTGTGAARPTRSIRRGGPCTPALTCSLTDRSRTVTFRVRVYTAIEVARLLEDVGFAGVECFGDLDERKLWRESRLVVGARKPVR
jgi:hypothetical protein